MFFGFAKLLLLFTSTIALLVEGLGSAASSSGCPCNAWISNCIASFDWGVFADCSGDWFSDIGVSVIWLNVFYLVIEEVVTVGWFFGLGGSLIFFFPFGGMMVGFPARTLLSRSLVNNYFVLQWIQYQIQILIKLLANGQKFVLKQCFEHLFVKLLLLICNKSLKEIFCWEDHLKILILIELLLKFLFWLSNNFVASVFNILKHIE